MQYRYKKRSWFFVFRNLWSSNPRESRFLAGLVSGAAAVTLITLILVQIIRPSARGISFKEIGGGICEELACFAYRYPPPEIEKCTPGLQTACVNVKLRIEASRRLVVDQAGKVLRIYSNTLPETREFRIFASYQDGGTEEVLLTENILEQYNKIEPKINWEERGLVYEYRPFLAEKAWLGLKNLIKNTLFSNNERQKQISANISKNSIITNSMIKYYS